MCRLGSRSRARSACTQGSTGVFRQITWFGAGRMPTTQWSHGSWFLGMGFMGVRVLLSCHDCNLAAGEPKLITKHCGNELFLSREQLRTNATISHYRQRVEQVAVYGWSCCISAVDLVLVVAVLAVLAGQASAVSAISAGDPTNQEPRNVPRPLSWWHPVVDSNGAAGCPRHRCATPVPPQVQGPTLWPLATPLIKQLFSPQAFFFYVPLAVLYNFE